MSEVRVIKRGSHWQYVFEAAKIDGKRQRITKSGFTTKGAAYKAGVEVMNEYCRTGVKYEPSRESVADMLDEWLASYGANNLKMTTQRGYKKKIEYLIKPEIGGYRLSALLSITLQKLIDDIADRHYSRNTISSVFSILNKALNFAVISNKIAVNPMSSVYMPAPRSEKYSLREDKRDILTQDEIQKIFQRFPVGSSSHLPMMIAYHCGLRLGEVFGLTWNEIDFEAKTLSVVRQVQWDPHKQAWYCSRPKYDSFRTIHLDETILRELRETKDKQERAKVFYDKYYVGLKISSSQIIGDSGEDFPAVMRRENGEYIHPRIMQHASGIIHSQLGLASFKFHSLRHTHASMLIDSGIPVKYVSERLGHKNIKVTTNVYQHVTEDMKKRSEQDIDKLFDDD